MQQHAPAKLLSILAPQALKPLLAIQSGMLAEADVVVGVALHDQAHGLGRCLTSIFAQDLGGRRLAVVLLDDQSKDDWRIHVGDMLQRPDMVVLTATCGSAARTRNAILDFVDENFVKAKWVARLDADDCFTTPGSLAAACDTGDAVGCRFVLGGNRLVRYGRVLDRGNRASFDLLRSDRVLSILGEMADGTAVNELPSCNLLLSVRSGWRYPDVASAEDHWLVADLLINYPHLGGILREPFYCDYSLGGAASQGAQYGGRHGERRKYLFTVATAWVRAKEAGGRSLGFGQEGMVRLIGDMIEKRFYPGAISDRAVLWLQSALNGAGSYLPDPAWEKDGEEWVCRYANLRTVPAEKMTEEQATEFLTFCLERGIVCKNIKRANFRVDGDARLIMIDVGNDIIPMHLSYLRDSAARLYAIAGLGWPDGELARRKSLRRQEDVLGEIPGFERFYRALLTTHAEGCWISPPTDSGAVPMAQEVTLLIKACAMDAESLTGQVSHILHQLSSPRRFREVVILLDPFRGPFLRQHCHGDYHLLLREAQALMARGLVDHVLVAPDDEEVVSSVNRRWFAFDCDQTHSAAGVPVAPQLWAFEQIATRYVLQCDVDVLIGRRDLDHDYLTEILAALAAGDVLGVAFNIPQSEGAVRPYDAPPGEYVPEVRCGLLDLQRIMACQPLPNSLSIGGALTLSWYRSLQQRQREDGFRTLRGGDARTFYIHPPNGWKSAPDRLAVVRDLTAQGRVPACQYGAWDLTGDAEDWCYEPRSESIVFVMKGRNTPTERLRRCFASLIMQNDQDFGLVVIDDASDETDPTMLPRLMGPLMTRATLIRRHYRYGRMPNFITAIREICTHAETLIVILDLDDALMHPGAVAKLRARWLDGHDVIFGGVFRPDKPLKLYEPSFDDPRGQWGGNVWTHMRAFRKRLFDAIPEEDFQIDGDWIEECTDYATMIPIVEICQNPTFIAEYLYFHERTTPNTAETRMRKDDIIVRILDKPRRRGAA